MQATEVVKLAMDYGETLDGRLIAYDAAEMSFEEIPVAANPDCPVCGEDPAIASVADASYEGRCSLAED